MNLGNGWLIPPIPERTWRYLFADGMIRSGRAKTQRITEIKIKTGDDDFRSWRKRKSFTREIERILKIQNEMPGRIWIGQKKISLLLWGIKGSEQRKQSRSLIWRRWWQWEKSWYFYFLIVSTITGLMIILSWTCRVNYRSYDTPSPSLFRWPWTNEWHLLKIRLFSWQEKLC